MRLWVPVILMGGWVADWTHNLDFWRGPRPPSPSKENETPGTGDLEGRPPLHPHFGEPAFHESVCVSFNLNESICMAC
jgi:hypothetical protein